MGKARPIPSYLAQAVPVLAIFALGAFLRLYRLEQVPPGLHPDEAMNGINALEAWRSGRFEVFYPENDGREGLFINIQAVALGLIGRTEPWVLRLVSAVFGILTVVAMYYFSREFLDETTARLATLFMATSVWHIIMSRVGTRPVSSLCFLLWSLYLFPQSARKISVGSNRWGIDAVVAGLLYGLGFHTYSAYRVTPLVVAILLPRLVREYGWPRIVRVGAVFAGTAMLVVSPLVLYFLAHRGDLVYRAGRVAIFASEEPVRQFLQNVGKTTTMYLIDGDPNWRHNFSGNPMLFWPVGMLSVFGCVLAACRQRWLLAFWAVGALPAILSNEGLPHALRSILTIPPALLTAALGGSWLWRRFISGLPFLAQGALAFAVAIALAVSAYRSYFVQWGTHPSVADWFYVEAVAHARRLSAVPRDVPKYVLLQPEEAKDLRYVRGLPSSARTITFLTDTFSPENQRALNIHYQILSQTNAIPHGAHLEFIPLPVSP